MFWSELSEHDRRAVTAVGIERRYGPDTVLFHENDEPTHAMVVLAGRVKISRVALDGREIIIELRGDGDLVGELGPFDQQPRNATATAIDQLTALVIPADRFRHLLVARGSVAVAVLSTVARKLRQATDRRLSDGTSDTLTRLCGRLVELADRQSLDQQDAISIDSPFTQQELAEWVGVSREAIVLALRDLRGRGLIETGRRTIRLLDLDRLRAMARDGA